jgi:hypothetical protein
VVIIATIAVAAKASRDLKRSERDMVSFLSAG